MDEMTAEQERDLLARQRDWLLDRLKDHSGSMCYLVKVVTRAFIHDPADPPEAPDAF